MCNSGGEPSKQLSQPEEFMDAHDTLPAPPQAAELSNDKPDNPGDEDIRSVKIEELPAAVQHAEPSANGNSKSSTNSTLSSAAVTSPSEE